MHDVNDGVLKSLVMHSDFEKYEYIIQQYWIRFQIIFPNHDLFILTSDS